MFYILDTINVHEVLLVSCVNDSQVIVSKRHTGPLSLPPRQRHIVLLDDAVVDRLGGSSVGSSVDTRVTTRGFVFCNKIDTKILFIPVRFIILLQKIL